MLSYEGAKRHIMRMRTTILFCAPKVIFKRYGKIAMRELRTHQS